MYSTSLIFYLARFQLANCQLEKLSPCILSIGKIVTWQIVNWQIDNWQNCQQQNSQLSKWSTGKMVSLKNLQLANCHLAKLIWQNGYLATLSHVIVSTGKALPGNFVTWQNCHMATSRW